MPATGRSNPVICRLLPDAAGSHGCGLPEIGRNSGNNVVSCATRPGDALLLFLNKVFAP